ncbi:MAG: TatD family hydrolase [Candidatus Saccharibacteria bacterium]
MSRNEPSTTVIDSHCHLQDPRFKQDVEEVIARALEGGVEMMVCVGYDLESSKEALDLARRHKQIKVVAGVHPHDAKTLDDRVMAELWEMARLPEVVAVGEMGLDFYRNLSEPELQRKAFRAQVRLAKEAGKPVVIHDRDAHDEVLAIIKEEKAGANGGVMHCYSGHLPLAVEIMKEGFYISFAGPLTFSNAKKSAEVAAHIPLEKILIETDCPYLTPEPYRGKRNEPLYVREVAGKVAELRNKSFEEVAYTTSLNTKRVFGIK